MRLSADDQKRGARMAKIRRGRQAGAVGVSGLDEVHPVARRQRRDADVVLGRAPRESLEVVEDVDDLLESRFGATVNHSYQNNNNINDSCAARRDASNNGCVLYLWVVH